MQSCAGSKKNSPSVTTSASEKPSSDIQKKYSELLGVRPVDITNKTLYHYIDKWMNTSYQYGGQNETGIDCSGFTQKLFDAVYNKKLPRTSEAQFASTATINNTRNLVEGDLVFFTTIKGKKISHVGIYLQNNKFISATNKGVLVAPMDMKYWSEKFVAGGRVQ